MKKTLFSLNSRLTFGKYKGELVSKIITKNPRYLEWARDEIEWFELDKKADEALDDALADLDDDGDDRDDSWLFRPTEWGDIE